MSWRVLILSVWLLGAGASAARADDHPRFAHDRHLALAGWNEILGCGWCHDSPQADQHAPAGRLIHNRCNAIGCHAQDFEDLTTRVCLTCHLTKSRVPEKARALVDFPREPTFFAELSHQSHLAGKAARALTDACKDCHASKEKRPTHANCERSGCHTGPDATPPMSECDGCHRDLFDDAGARVWSGPRRRTDRCRVTTFFSHAKHEARKTSCGNCHLSVPTAARLGDLVATNGGRTMESACGKCHDGKRAFSVRGSCESCHTHACVVEGP